MIIKVEHIISVLALVHYGKYHDLFQRLRDLPALSQGISSV